jgi:D-alanyl-D-alanine-carboxypeptidase/D-alanyl-D-alanine-endopeptidase
MRRLFCLLLLSASSLAAVERPPLGDHLASTATTLPKGAVASAEKRDGSWQYSIAGMPFAAGHASVPPEKVLFEIGSISKVFTGLLLADAVLDGKLGLDDTLAQRLPVKFTDPEVGAVTLKQLATHTSCLPRLPDNMTTVTDSDPYATYDRKALFAYLGAAKLSGKAPCEPTYSNLGFAILGTVLEVTYQSPWASLVERRITAPLGMVDTVQDLSTEQRARLADPWDKDRPGHLWTFQAMAGAGALHSTTLDLSKFADAWLAGAQGPLGKAWPLLAGDYVEVPFIGGKTGLGLNHMRPQKGDPEGDRYGHDGGTGSYRSFVEIWPRDHRGAVVLASSSEANPVAWLLTWTVGGDLAPPRTAIVLPASTLDEYPGVYPIDATNRFTVLKRGDQLWVRLTGQPFWPVYATAKDEFFYKVVAAQLSFQRDASGKLDGLVLHQNGNDVPARHDAGPPPHIEFPPVKDLSSYAGEYDLGATPPVILNIVVAQETLTGQLTGQAQFPAFATGKDRFEFDVVPAALTFERDASGNILAVVLHQGGNDVRALRRASAPVP